MGLFSSLFQKEKEPAKTTTQTDIEPGTKREPTGSTRSEEHTSELQSPA